MITSHKTTPESVLDVDLCILAKCENGLSDTASPNVCADAGRALHFERHALWFKVVGNVSSSALPMI